MKHFVPVADEVWRLQHEKGRDCDLFRKIAEEGHYAGRTFPSDTRQGIYALSPSGVLLGSINNNDAKHVAAMLDAALAKWDALADADRWQKGLTDDTTTGGSDFVSRQPAGSLVLKVFCRDLDRRDGGDDVQASDYNVDFAWLRPKELESFVPRAAIGASCDVTPSVVRRFAALHFVDTVRGQTNPYEDKEIESAALRCTVAAVEGDLVTIEFSGRTKARAEGRWAVSSSHDATKLAAQERGVDLELGGVATWNTASSKFVDFHLTGCGTRFGGTQYNDRSRDLAPSAIGFAVVLADPQERVPPASSWRYPTH